MALAIPILIFIALAIGLTWFFLANDHGEREPIGALWIAFGLGLLGAIAAGLLESQLIPKQYSTPTGYSASLGLLAATMGIGFIEEICKFGPLAAFIYKKRYFNEHLDGVIYFGLAGLGFGLPENILYSIGFGINTSIARLVLTPFFHVATTALIGYFLIKVKLDHKPAWQAGLALIAMAVLHGFYDFGAFAGGGYFMLLSLMLTMGITAMLFVLYMRAGEIDREQGLSTVGHNTFCRSCGYPNPKHNLYCVRCGRRA